MPDLRPQRTVLFASEQFEVVSIEWTERTVSDLHAHGWSACMVQVQEGTFENHLELGFKTERQVLEVGQVCSTPYGADHKMRCLTAAGRTLHVYVPKIVDRKDERQFGGSAALALKQELELGAAPTPFVDLTRLLEDVRKSGITTHSPFFMNQLFSGVLPEMALAEGLLAQTKTTMATFEASPVFSLIEKEVVEALGARIGWPEGQRDGITLPGGSAANFMALHCARHRALPEYKKQGLGAKRFRVFVSADAHYSFSKACVALGLGGESLTRIATDARGRMDVGALATALDACRAEGASPLLVAATAGTTVYGSFDPLAEIAEVCRARDIWFHVDAAWGGPALFSPKLRSLVAGVEHADSLTFDAHKLYGAGLTCSFFLDRHPGLLLEANDVSGADYLFHDENPQFDRGRLSWQCGRRPDAFGFWTIWKSVGTEGLARFVDRLTELREEVVAHVEREARLELVKRPEYLNVCVRVSPADDSSAEDWSRLVRERLKEQNLALVNFARDERGTFLRLILAHPGLEFAHVRQILDWALAQT